LQQLGELAKIKSTSLAPEEKLIRVAQNYCEHILAIDPEDVSVHYNLIAVYQ